MSTKLEFTFGMLAKMPKDKEDHEAVTVRTSTVMLQACILVAISPCLIMEFSWKTLLLTKSMKTGGHRHYDGLPAPK